MLGVEVREIRIPLLRPHLSAGTAIDVRRLMLIRLHTAAGDGWGEIGPVPGYSTATVDGLWNPTATLAERLVGADATSPDSLVPSTVAPPELRHGVEAAAWDSLGRLRGAPVATLLGGSPGRVAVGAVAGLDTPVEHLDGLAAAGYRRIKLKVDGAGDLERVAAVRLHLGESFPLAIDANGSFDPDRIDELAVDIDRLGLEFVEQPFPADRLESSAALATAMQTPVCLDESVTGTDSARTALEIGAARLLALKPARLGGLAAALRVVGAARTAGAAVWVGGMLESGIGRAASAALARALAIGPAADLAPPGHYLSRDTITRPATLEDGCIEVPDRPGLGFDVDLDTLDDLTVRRSGAGAF